MSDCDISVIAAAMKVAKQTISSNQRIFIQSSAFQSLYRLHNLTLLILLISVMNGFFVDQYDLKAPDSLLPSSVYIFQTVLNLSFIRSKNHGNRKPWQKVINKKTKKPLNLTNTKFVLALILSFYPF